ncbi:MAG: hypothetical protein IIX43_03920 [Bacteroidales bacterium]|nr:hypothetical protein [Bacteroidales bacterium]MEE0910106.1 hypothetical protein [Bacteroidales bacterium]
MAEGEKTNVFVAILSFLIPILGVVLYFVKKNDTIEVAKNYLYAGLTGFGLNLLLMLAAL